MTWTILKMQDVPTQYIRTEWDGSLARGRKYIYINIRRAHMTKLKVLIGSNNTTYIYIGFTLKELVNLKSKP